MIKITVELWPFGSETGKKTLAEARIWNDGCGSPFLGSYGYELLDKGGNVKRAGFLGEFKRQKFSVWWLVAAVMREAFRDVSRAFRDERIVHRAKE